MSALAPGFADAPRDSQRAFKALMWAMARPGHPEPLISDLKPPMPLTPELATLALTLLDYETTVWLDAPLASAPAVKDFLRFHTSARIVEEPQDAQFALIRDPAGMPDFSAFAQGEPDYPDRSATLLLAVEQLADGPFEITGPGIEGNARFGAAPLPADMAARLAANRALFPLGVDIVLAAPGQILGLPRSVRLREEG